MAAPALKKGLVKGVPTGDTVFLQGPIGKNGLPLEKHLRLIGVSSPTVAHSADSDEHELGFESREFLRKLVVGQKIEFEIEATINKQEYGRVLLNGKDVSTMVLEKGFAELNTVIEGTKTRPVNLDFYEKAREGAKTAKRGIFAEQKPHIRKFEKNPDLAAFFEKNKSKSVKAIVEEVNGQTLTVYLLDYHFFVKTHVSDVNIPIVNYAHVQELRCFIEERMLHRDVELLIKKFDAANNLFYCDYKLSSDLDLKKELLYHGYAKLSQESLMELEVNAFKTYKTAMENAQNNKLKIWKDFKQTVKNSKKEETVFIGKVIEIKSGDNLIIENPDTRELKRYYLANVKAPQMGNFKRNESDKPYAFEAKEYLRTMTIGRKLKVEIEFSKVIQKPIDEEKKESETRVFVTLLLGEKNVSEALIENGLANVAPPRLDEDFSKYLKQLKEAEERAKAAKVGLFSVTEGKLHRFNDMSLQKKIPKLKEFFSLLKDEKKLTGVVELVLSGSRYKVRINQHNCYIILLLHGIKCLTNDKNVREHEILSNKAMDFAKDNILQRDVEIELEACDNRGLYHGNVVLNKKSFASNLLENGFAHTFTVGSSGSRYQNEYKRVEEQAKNQKLGMWKDGSLKLDVIEGSTSFKELKEKKSGLQVSEIISGNEFFLQDPKNKYLVQIQKALSEFDPDSEKLLVAPIKKGTPCVAEFTDDGNWYRARIERHVKGETYLVYFIDYGNSDEVSLSNIRVMPSKILSLESQAKRCALSYVLTPKMEHEIGDSVAQYLKDQLWGKNLEAHFVYEEGGISYCLLYFEGKTDVKQSINFNLILKGYAKVDKRVSLPGELSFWNVEEETAMDKKLGLWKYGDDFSEDEDY